MKTKATIAKKSDKELEKAVFDMRTELASFKRDRYVNDEKNLRQAKNMRRELARMLTELNQRRDSESEVITDKTEEEPK